MNGRRSLGALIIRSTLVLAAVTVTALWSASSAHAAVTTNVKVPIDGPILNPCGNSGAGEIVDLTGTLHILATQNVDASGGIHLKLLLQPMGVRGVGEITGTRYEATGVAGETVNVNGAAEASVTSGFRLIGSGPRNNLEVHEVLHVTLNANEVVTVTAGHLSIACH